MIRRALGFGLMLLILKFLMSEVFSAGQDTAVSLLNSANVLFSNIGSMDRGFEVENLIPR